METPTVRGRSIRAAPKAQMPSLPASAPTAYPASPDLQFAELECASWKMVRRVASCRRFGRSALLTNFLLFVAHRSLTGRNSEINEQQIGVHVFGRDAQFNRSDDNIVRTYARLLRQRLEAYFRNEGREETLIVAIPRGSYVPVFIERELIPEGAPHSESETAEVSPMEALPCDTLPAELAPPAISRPASLTTALNIGLAVTVLVLAAVLAAVVAITHLDLDRSFQAQTSDGRINHRLWSHLFEANRDTYIVPADGGLVMLQSFLPSHINLTDYANGNYRSAETIRQGLRSLTSAMPATASAPLPEADLPSLVHKVEVISARRYTSVVDLELTSQLTRLSEVVPPRLMIRYARDLRMDDLRTGNLILLGSADSNPWTEVFQPQLNFQFTVGAGYGGSPVIVNRHPLTGESGTYRSDDGGTAHRSYGVIAYLPNLGMTGAPGSSAGEGSGHVLLVEGVNMAGTQAVGAFLLSPEKMRPILERATAPNGVLRSFEVLIETSNIAANSGRTHILSQRIIFD